MLAQSTEMTAEQALKTMEEAIGNFAGAIHETDCYGFQQFVGLMNEYLKLCHEFQAKHPDMDFRHTSRHGTDQLEYYPQNLNYINEKLAAIFQGRFIMQPQSDSVQLHRSSQVNQ